MAPIHQEHATQQAEFLEIVGIVHKNYPELDFDNYYGGYLKPSEFQHVATLLKGKPVTLDHTRDKNGKVVQVVGEVIDAFVDPTTGHLKAKIFVPLNSELAHEVKRDLLDNPINPRRNLSFGANALVGIGPGVPGVSETTKFKQGFDFDEVALVYVPGVPESKIENVNHISQNLNTGQITYIREEIFNSITNQPKIVEMEAQQQTQQTQQQQQVPDAQLVRPTPTNFEQVRTLPPQGGSLEKDLLKQDQQLGVTTHTQQLTPAQEMMAKSVRELQAQQEQMIAAQKALTEQMEQTKKQKEEWDAYNKQMEEEKKRREEEELRKKYAPEVDREKSRWAVLENRLVAQHDAAVKENDPDKIAQTSAGLAEFYEVQKEHFNKLSLGQLSKEIKYEKAVEACNASLEICGIQNQQQEISKNNNEQTRILLEQHKALQENLQKEKEKVEKLSGALNMAAANVNNPKVAFDISEFVKQTTGIAPPQPGMQQPQQPGMQAQQPGMQGMQQGMQAPQVQPYQPPNQWGYQHQGNHMVQFHPSAAYQNGGMYPPPQQQAQAPKVAYDPNMSTAENVEAHFDTMFFTGAPFLNHERAVQVATRVVETTPEYKKFKAVPEFAARNPEAFEAIERGGNGSVLPFNFI